MKPLIVESMQPASVPLVDSTGRTVGTASVHGGVIVATVDDELVAAHLRQPKPTVRVIYKVIVEPIPSTQRSMTVEEAQALCHHRFEDASGNRVYLHCQSCDIRDPLEPEPEPQP